MVDAFKQPVVDRVSILSFNGLWCPRLGSRAGPTRSIIKTSACGAP